MELFISDSGERIRPEHFSQALTAVGVRQSDTLFVHADIGVWGKLLVQDRAPVLGALCRTLTTAVGARGTVVMPTFTYSFCRGETYDVLQSRSNMGALNEYFRTLPEVVRTRHPLFSVAIWGNNREEFHSVGPDSFDRQSIFGHLHRTNALIVFFGVPFMTTFIHYIEQDRGVPYRSIKKFSGTIITEDGTEKAGEATYFVRPLDGSVVTDLTKLEKRLHAKHLLEEARVGNGVIRAVRAEDLYREGTQMLTEDIYSLVQKPPTHV